MNTWMVLRISLRALLRNKLRTFLTTLGIIIGVSTVITMLAIGNGAKTSVDKTIAGLGTNILMVFPGAATSSGGARSGAFGATTLTVEDARAIAREVRSVRAASPVTQSNAQVVYQDQNWNTQITGADVSYLEIRNWPLASGRYFMDDDIRAAAKVCVLGKVIVDNLFGGEDPIDQMVRVRGIPMKVVGVLSEKGSSSFGASQDDIIIIPYTTSMKRLMRGRSSSVRMVIDRKSVV